MPVSARWYEDVAVPAIFAPFAKDLAQSAGGHAGERLLDVACGTGIAARSVAGRAPRPATAVGIDIRPAALKVAVQAAGKQGLPIRFVVGRAERLPLPDAAFDLILCQFGLMLFDEPAAALREMKRVLAPHGRLLVSVWDSIDLHPLDREIHERSLEQLGASGLEGVYALGDEGRLRSLILESGFEDVAIEHVAARVTFPDPYAYLDWQIGIDPVRSPVLRGLDAAGRRAMLASVRQGLESTLQQYTHDGQLLLELHALKAICGAAAGQ